MMACKVKSRYAYMAWHAGEIFATLTDTAESAYAMDRCGLERYALMGHGKCDANVLLYNIVVINL